jgi:hypothetical protein
MVTAPIGMMGWEHLNTTLVPGSSPGGPTIIIIIQSLMSLRPGDWSFAIIPWSRAPFIEFMELCH